MKRRLLIIAIFLLAGAVVNVAVAWAGCVFSAQGPMGSGNIKGHWDLVHPTTANLAWLDRKGWRPRPQDDHLVYQAASREITGLDLGVEMRLLFGIDSNQRTMCAIHVLSGWPARSMSGETWDAFVLGQQPKWSNRRAMFVGRAWIPLRPIWPGFLINTLFYASILWLLIPGPFALRRFLRVRRGLCPKCAYPIGESAICSECGITLPRRRRMPNLT